MNIEDYEKKISEFYTKAFKETLDLNKSIVKFKIGDIVKSGNRLYIIKSIDYGYNTFDADKSSCYFFPPCIRMFGTVYYHKKKKGSGNISYLYFFDLLMANEHDINLVKEQFRAKINKQRKLKRDTDPLYRMECSLRSRIRIAFKSNGWKKPELSKKLLGVEFHIAKDHLESKFKDGMSWDNYGQWEIDHIIPMGSADTIDELTCLCHYSNLQPLWQEENRIKSNKMPNIKHLQ